jgi:hypothetical protein
MCRLLTGRGWFDSYAGGIARHRWIHKRFRYPIFFSRQLALERIPFPHSDAARDWRKMDPGLAPGGGRGTPWAFGFGEWLGGGNDNALAARADSNGGDTGSQQQENSGLRHAWDKGIRRDQDIVPIGDAVVFQQKLQEMTPRSQVSNGNYIFTG